MDKGQWSGATLTHTWIALPEGWNKNFESSVTASCRACSSTRPQQLIKHSQQLRAAHSGGYIFTVVRTLTARLYVLGKLTSVFLLGKDDTVCDVPSSGKLSNAKLCTTTKSDLKCGTDQRRTRESVAADSQDKPFGIGSSAVTRPSCAVAMAVGSTTSCSALPSVVFGLEAHPPLISASQVQCGDRILLMGTPGCQTAPASGSPHQSSSIGMAGSAAERWLACWSSSAMQPARRMSHTRTCAADPQTLTCAAWRRPRECSPVKASAAQQERLVRY